MKPVFIDTNIPMYAAGTPHPLREPSRGVIRAVAAGELEVVIHLAVMLRYDVHEIITADKGFDKVKEVRQIDPTTFP